LVITQAKILQPEIKAQKIMMTARNSTLAKEVISPTTNAKPLIDKTAIATASIPRSNLLANFISSG
jgi:hypothetical protein